MKFSFRPYLRYKFLNALFSGVVGGSVFTVYTTLSPITFSVGGIVLAFGMMGIALFYHRLMKLTYFFTYTLMSEVIMLLMVAYYLLFSSHPLTALVVYAAYQLSFVLGGYLARAETYFARRSHIMGWFDISKQQGYIAGLTFSYGFYKVLEHYGITKATEQVYHLHFVLFALECMIIVALLLSFKKTR